MMALSMCICELEFELLAKLRAIKPGAFYQCLGGAYNAHGLMPGDKGRPHVDVLWPVHEGSVSRAEGNTIRELIDDYLVPIEKAKAIRYIDYNGHGPHWCITLIQSKEAPSWAGHVKARKKSTAAKIRRHYEKKHAAS